MCAIFGILGSYDRKTADLAFGKLSHRGPDATCVVANKNLFFAHHRLAIQDTHHRANQPFVYNDILISFNGEIYNFNELKSLVDFDFKTNSDVEVIVALYLKYGKDFTKYLRGMFAIAIYDDNRLLLFRDRFGKKPIYYLKTKDSFIFASEIKALLPFLKQTKLNNDAFLSYMSFLAPTNDLTFFDGIKKLPPSSYLEFKNGDIEVKRYYNLLDITPNQIIEKKTALKDIEELIIESIRLRLKSDVSIASLLSGGIDSSTINYFAKKLGYVLPTYTIGYKEYSKYDESSLAKESADELGIENKIITIDKNRFIDNLDDVLDTLDEPLNDPASIPLYILFDEIKKDGFRVVLSGEGSDEIFLGYRQYFEYIEIEKAKTIYHKNWLKKYFRSNFSMNREWEWYKRAFEDEVVFRTSGEKFSDMQLNILLKQNIKDGHNMEYIRNYRSLFEKSNYNDETIWFSYIDIYHFLAEHFLMKLDKTSMAHSIEARTPFLDHFLVEKLFSLKPELRYKNGRKSLLKDVMKNKLSDNILNRKKKGFSNPYMEYLFESGRINLIEEVNEKLSIFKKDILLRYIQTAKKGNFKQHVWGLYLFSHWAKKYLL